ncbi:MAG: hypothetical protein ACJ785_00825 [Gemmatimonadaceae bacterium]
MRCDRFMPVALVFAVGVLANCTSEQPQGITAAPRSAAFGGNTPPPPCDPKKDNCVLLGRMTGGGNSVSAEGVKITKGLTLHCDIILSNNLEINWPDGNNWHLTKPIESANCIDDPAVNPAPPPAPFDTFIGTATGSLNGVDGSYIEFTFVDAGEPGGKNDKLALKIYTGGPGTTVALDLPLQFTTGGNLQAHYDQPHK